MNRIKFNRKRSVLEIFKFTLCVFIPLASSAVFANPKVMHQIIREYGYVKYPEAKVVDIDENVKKLRDEIHNKPNSAAETKLDKR